MWVPSRSTTQIWLNLLLSLCFLISVQVITRHSVSYTKNLMSYSVYVLCAKLFQSCWTLCDPVDLNPPGSSVHRIPQARIPKWVAIPFSRRSLVVNFSSNLPLSIPSIPSSANLGSIKTHFHYILYSYHLSPHSDILRYYVPSHFQFLVFPSFNLSSRFAHRT